MKLADVYRHSMVIAADYRIPDSGKVWPLLQERKDALAAMGAHHVLVYRSIRESGRVLVMIGVRSREPVVDLLRSRVLFDWFDDVGIADLPAVFAGEIVDRFHLSDADDEQSAGVLVSAIVSVDDVAWLIGEMHTAKAVFKSAGIRKVWIFQAFDDPNEVLVLQEFDFESSARRWLKRHDTSADWMERAGVGVYPPLFIGEYGEMMRVDADETGPG